MHAAVARALRRTRPFARESEERVAVALLIELPEVVEAELRAGHGAKTGGDAGVCAQRFFDGADRLAGAACIAQVEPQRRHRGEPADGAREIDSVERLVAAVPFEIDEQRTLPRPARHRAGEGGEQQVVDVCVVRGRRLFQQRPRRLGRELGGDGDGVAERIRPLDTVDRQRRDAAIPRRHHDQ